MTRILSVLIGLSVCSSALAHHSAAMFDKTKELTLAGTVKEFLFTNPHTWIYLIVVDEHGTDGVWELEGGSVSHMVRNGWTSKSLAPGDKITIKVYQRKDGTTAGEFHDVVTADGRELNFSPVNN
jgi:Family of unknown function (DUF6152)